MVINSTFNSGIVSFPPPVNPPPFPLPESSPAKISSELTSEAQPIINK